MSEPSDQIDKAAGPIATLPESVACVRCLTSLGGVPLDGACPKCELPAAVSVPASVRTMIEEGLRCVPDGLLCQRCGCSLGGLTLKERCPQCELTVEQSIAGGGWQPALDEHGAVLTDLPCVRCGYNLRSLQEDGNCPECGLSVGSSTHGHFLCRSEPNWVRGIAIGSSIISFCMTMVGLAALVSLVTLLLPFPGSLASGFLWFAIIPFVTLLGCAGVWIITGREHGWHVAAPIRRSRRLARVGLTVGICSPIAAVSVTLSSFGGLSILHWGILLLGICGGLWIGLPSYFKYVQYLSLRIPNQRLVERAETLGTAVALSLVTLTICVTAFVVIGAMGGWRSSFVVPIAVIAMIPGAVTVAFLCTAYMFQVRLSRALHGQVDAARSNASAMEQ